MINQPWLKRQVLRLLTGYKRYEDLCDRQWVLHPSERRIAHPAIYQVEALDRVTGVQSETTFEVETARLQGGMRTHRATTAYQLHKVQIRQGYLYKDAMRLAFSTTPDSWWQSGQIEAIAEASLASTPFGARYFGHLLLDDLTLAIAAQSLAPAMTIIPTRNQQFGEYQALFAIASRFVQNADCASLILIDDVGQNGYKRDRLRQLRSQLAETSPAAPPRGVFLRRGQSGSQRALVNEAAIMDWLERQGFVCLVPETLSAPELIRQMGGTKIVLGVEGSQLAHGVYSLAAGGVMCALQPPYRFNNVFKDYLDCIDQDLRYAVVVGRQVENGFEIDLDDLAKTIEQIDHVIATCPV